MEQCTASLHKCADVNLKDDSGSTSREYLETQLDLGPRSDLTRRHEAGFGERIYPWATRRDACEGTNESCFVSPWQAGDAADASTSLQTTSRSVTKG